MREIMPEHTRADFLYNSLKIVIAELKEKYHLNERTDESVIDTVHLNLTLLVQAFGGLEGIKGKRILDLACGSNDSNSTAPSNGPRTYEPWLCRAAKLAGADPVGIDINKLDSEEFEHYQKDLGEPGALDFLPSHSFDAINMANLIWAHEFTQIYSTNEQLDIRARLRAESDRLLKPGGIKLGNEF